MISDEFAERDAAESVVASSVAFDDVYRREYASIVRIAWSLSGRRAVAEEIAQDTFVAAHRHWSRVGTYADVGAWLRRVAINASLSTLRRRAVEARGLVRLGSERRHDDVLPESTDEVWTALRKLSRRQAEVLVLVVVEDRSIADVSTILECGEETVRSHLRRGRARLAELLGVEVSDDDA